MAFNEQRLMELFLRVQPSNMSLFIDAESVGTAAAPHEAGAGIHPRKRGKTRSRLSDVSDAAGVTPRMLQLAFKAAFGVSPMRALQQERLRLVRFELLNRASATCVSDVGAEMGFLPISAASRSTTAASLARRRGRRSPEQADLLLAVFRLAFAQECRSGRQQETDQPAGAAVF
jgi:AraC-like DNA-binding protein